LSVNHAQNTFLKTGYFQILIDLIGCICFFRSKSSEKNLKKSTPRNI
jgi:hypothetical protein